MLLDQSQWYLEITTIGLLSVRSSSLRSIDMEYTTKSLDLIKELVDHYIYQGPNPSWGEFQVALYDYGYTMSEVYNIMRDVQDGMF